MAALSAAAVAPSASSAVTSSPASPSRSAACVSCACAQSRCAFALLAGGAQQLGRQLGARSGRELGAQERDRVAAAVGVQVGRDERLAQGRIVGAMRGDAALQPVDRVVLAAHDLELVRDAHVAGRRLKVVRELPNQAIDVAERARERLAHGAQRQSRMRERDARIGRHRAELARQDRVERREPRVAEQRPVALRRVVHPLVVGLLGQLDEPRGERLGLGRHGTAGVEMETANLLAQRVHVGIGRAELAERLVDAEDRVLGERDAAAGRGSTTSSCSSTRVSWMRAAKRAGPRQATSRDGLVTAVRPLRTVTASTVLTDSDDLHVEAVAARRGARGVVGHGRQASTLAPREDRDCVYEQRFSGSHRGHGTL